MKRRSQNSNETISLDSIDLAKLILSLMVVAIHVSPVVKNEKYYEVLIPILRVAVPLFFMISSYLLFVKIKNMYNHEENSQEVKNKIIWNYIIRILKLYLVWFLILLPVTVMLRNYFVTGIPMGLMCILKGFIFGSTFPASWYLMALIIGIIFVYIICNQIRDDFGNMVVLLVGNLLYILCCLFSNYGNAIGRLNIVSEVYPATFYNSFPASVVWIALGKVFAENEQFADKIKKFRYSGVIVSIILLYIEQYMILNFRWKYENDCYFMLLPCCIFIFSIIICSEVQVRNAKEMRKMSTIIYCMHFSVSVVLDRLLLMIGLYSEKSFMLIVKYILVLVICIFASLVIIKLSDMSKEIKYLRFLRYFY